MIELNIIIPGKPIAKKRSRKGKFNNWYNPQEKEQIIVQRQIMQQIYAGYKLPDKNVPVVITIKAFFEPTKIELKDKKFLELIKDDCYPFLKKIDSDNILKFYMDSMNGIIYHDDKQVFSSNTDKYYSLNARTEINIILSKGVNVK